MSASPAAISEPDRRIARRMARPVFGPALRWLSIVLLITWLVLPLVPLTIWSFARGWFFPEILPSQYSLQAWTYVFSKTSGVVDSMWVTIFIALGTTALSVLVGVPAGRALGLYNFRGKQFIELLILAPTIVPGIAVALGIHAVFLAYGLTNTVWGVMLVHLVPTLPYMVLVMSGIFSNYDVDFEAQARSLGATPLKTFWYVTLPAILPGVIVGALFAFLVSWGQYILTLLIGSGRVITLPLLLFNFATSGRNDIAGAIGILYVLPGILVLIFTARFLSGNSAAVGGFGKI
jgi:putative spermidine/putrescine transport system permease protein